MYYRSLFLIYSKIETKKEKFPGARSEGKIPSRRSWELKLRGRVFWGLRFLDGEGRPVPVCFMYKTEKLERECPEISAHGPQDLAWAQSHLE